MSKQQERWVIKAGSSLLPVGITALTGEFKKGDLVACHSQSNEVARGFSNFNASELDQIIGLKSCLLYTSPSPRDLSTSRMPSSA